MPEIGTTDFRILIRMIITPHYEEFLDFPHIFQEILEEWTPNWDCWDIVELIYTRVLLISVLSDTKSQLTISPPSAIWRNRRAKMLSVSPSRVWWRVESHGPTADWWLLVCLASPSNPLRAVRSSPCISCIYHQLDSLYGLVVWELTARHW